MNTVEKAVQAAGGVLALAARFQIRRQAIEKWMKRERVPAERVLALEAASGVPRHKLRPDLYPKEKSIAV